MNKFVLLALVAAAGLAPFTAAAAEDSQSVRAVTDVAPVKVNAGMMLYSTAGYRVASVYRVNAEGNPQIILDGKLVTVPAATLSSTGGKVMTSLSKKELANAR